MSALSTRTLVLGVVKIFGPANGYRLRQELLSWNVERWAALNPGSIYSMLGTLAKDGAVTRHELSARNGERAATVFTITEAG
ncbi:MAG: helix-turn-helix transcriptional regulator, partial [Pseudolysinimonas sp.]